MRSHLLFWIVERKQGKLCLFIKIFRLFTIMGLTFQNNESIMCSINKL